MTGRSAIGLIIPIMDSKSNDMRDLFKRIAENPKIYIDYENENALGVPTNPDEGQ